MSRWAIGCIWIALILLVSGCGGGDDAGTTTPTTVADAVAAAGREVGFSVVLPPNVPSGVNTDPTIKVTGGKRVDIDYSNKPGATTPEGPYIQLTEQKDQFQRGGPFTTKTLAGVSVRWAEAVPGSGLTAAVDSVWFQGETHISALFTWGTRAAPIPLTDEMRQVAEELITSMIQASSPSGGAVAPTSNAAATRVFSGGASVGLNHGSVMRLISRDTRSFS